MAESYDFKGIAAGDGKIYWHTVLCNVDDLMIGRRRIMTKKKVKRFFGLLCRQAPQDLGIYPYGYVRIKGWTLSDITHRNMIIVAVSLYVLLVFWIVTS